MFGNPRLKLVSYVSTDGPCFIVSFNKNVFFFSVLWVKAGMLLRQKEATKEQQTYLKVSLLTNQKERLPGL